MGKREDEDAWALVLAETNDPEVKIRLLAFRLSVVVREKESQETRIKKLEVAYDLGKGIFWAAPIIVAVTAFFWHNWEWIYKPWSSR